MQPTPSLLSPRTSILGALALLCACQPDPSDPPVDTDGTTTGGSTTGGTAVVDDSTGDETTAGTDTGPVDCDFTPFEDDIVLDDGAALAFSGDVARAVVIGERLVACGDGFVQPDGGGELAIDGRCTGIAALTADQGVVVTDTGTTVLFSIGGGDASELDSVVDMAARHQDVAAADGAVFVASGPAGIQRFDPAADALGAATAVPGANDARGIASSAAGLVVADGIDGASLVDPDGGGSLASLDLDPDQETKRIARRVVVDGERAYVLRGTHGVSVVDLAGGALALLEWIETEGIALDVAPVDGGILVATGASLVRYALGDPSVVVSRQLRPDYGEPTGGWFRTVIATADGHLASVGSSAMPVTLGSGEPQPLLYVERSTYSFWATEGESTDSIIAFENRGTVPMRVSDVAIDPFVVEPLALDDQPGCDGQYVVEPNDRGLVQLTYADPTADAVSGSFTATTDTSDDAMFALRLEANRAAPTLGEAATSFEMLTHEGDLLRSTDMSDRVMFLKVFNET